MWNCWSKLYDYYIKLEAQQNCGTNCVTHEVFAECGKIRGMRDNHAKCVTGGNPNHHSYIIYFRFVEFLDLDYVKINTKIKSVACIQPEIMKVIWKYVWPFSRSTMEVRWHMLVILKFPKSDMFKSTPRLSLYHVSNPWWTRGHNK